MTYNVFSGTLSPAQSVSIAAADGRLNRFRQVAPMCPPMWADWRHLANTIELVFSLTHRVHSPYGKSIDSAVSAQLTTESPYTLQWSTLSPKLPLLMGDLKSHLIYDSLGEFEPTVQTASRLVQTFSRR